jgi:hypothetical protein
MQRYLDDTGLGNDPGVLTVLAFCEQGLLTLKPDAAQQQINEIMKSPKYASPSRDSKERLLEVAKLQILSRIAHRERSPAAVGRNPLAPSRTPAQAQAGQAARETSQAQARAEAEAMLAEKNRPLMNSGHPGHAAALAKWQKLISIL